MVNKRYDLKDHRALVRADTRWARSKKLQKDFDGDRYAYFKHTIGDRFQTVGTPDAWKSLLSRASKDVRLFNERQAAKKKANDNSKKLRRIQIAEAIGLEEEEVSSDIGRWVPKIVLWLPVLAHSVANVQNISQGMLQWADAREILDALGFGRRFVNQLVQRFMSHLGFCQGPILMMGTGTHAIGNLLCCTNKIDIDRCYTLYLAVLPMLNYLVIATLGAQWLAAFPVTFQVFQSLLCEARKSRKQNHPPRRLGFDERDEHLKNARPSFTQLLNIFAHSSNPARKTSPCNDDLTVESYNGYLRGYSSSSSSSSSPSSSSSSS